MIINMTLSAASRRWRTSAPMLPSAGQRHVHVPQLVIGKSAGATSEPGAGIQETALFIRNRVVDAAKPGSPPRGAPR